jgi:hypothetical protein
MLFLVEDGYQFTLKILGQYASPQVMNGVRQALVARLSIQTCCRFAF